MSVYTPLTHAQVEHFMAAFDLGHFLSFEGIEAGVENTNFFVTTDRAEYVLTIFEQHNHNEVKELVTLAHHLGQAGLQVPAPLEDKQGQWLFELESKPAILCKRLAGVHISTPEEKHCRAIGKALAELHIAAENLPQTQPDHHGLEWWAQSSRELGPSLSEDQAQLLADEVAYQQANQSQWQALPSGWVHGDLFHDNALFIANADGSASDCVGAILDLYHASAGTLLYDIAIVANDWCFDVNAQPIGDNLKVLLEGYDSVRPLTDAEHAALPQALRAGALRWWVGRLHNKIKQDNSGAELTKAKDPNEYRAKLLAHRG